MEAVILAFIFFVVAVLYAAVGQAGASGYLAAMALFSVAPVVMKPTALALNLLVAAIGTFQFWRMGLFSWRTFYPFAALGFPFSLIGGAVQLPAHIYHPLVGAILLFSAVQLWRSTLHSAPEASAPPAEPPFVPALLTGACIGFVSGTTGTGGGVFLAPVILAMNWVELRRTTCVTAAYNLLNSAAALIGTYATLGGMPAALPWWLMMVGFGGWVGAIVGSRYLPDIAIKRLLAVVLLVSGVKLILT
jgi:uncharacterized membrane protein YfcA